MLGHKCCAGVEIMPYAQSVLMQRQKDGWMPEFPIYGDLCALNGTEFKGQFDVLCGGFPCQAFSTAAHGKNIKEKTSEMAQAHNAILAINGDYYGSRDKGYVLRNGQLYRDKSGSDREDLVIWPDGSFGIAYERLTSADSLLESGAWQVFSFGPALVKKGYISVDEDTEVGQATYSNPRTAIAMVDELHYLMVVSDGRTERSAGLTLYQLAQFLQSKGAVMAYNLDGGGSSTMYFNGRVVNEPVNHGSTVSERSISDIVYIGY